MKTKVEELREIIIQEFDLAQVAVQEGDFDKAYLHSVMANTLFHKMTVRGE